MRDFGENCEIVKNDEEMDKCDMLCLMYDPDSLSSIDWIENKLNETILGNLNEEIPIILISALNTGTHQSEIQMKAISLCRKMNGTSEPLQVNLSNTDSLSQFKNSLFFDCKNYERFLTTNNRKWKIILVGGITSTLLLGIGSFFLYRQIVKRKKGEKVYGR